MSPIVVPPARPRSVASGAIVSTGAAPAMTRANTSRPRLSVPNQWSPLGEASVAAVSTACGSRTVQRQVSADRTQNITMPKPIRNVLE
jgi:hypothetical protein